MAKQLGDQGANNYLVVRDEKNAHQILQSYLITGKIIELDITENGIVDILLDAVKPAIVFNLIGYGIDRSERDERCAQKVNADLVRVLCNTVPQYVDRSWSGQNLVHVGSALEYGEIGGDLSEDSSPNPTTVYGRTKLSGTQLLSENREKLLLKGFSARLFTVYGPGEHPGRLLPSLIAVAKSGEDLQLTAGNQRRDFTYVEDIAAGLIRLGSMENIPWSVINLATGELHSVKEFVQVAAEELNIANEKLVFGGLPTRAEEMEHDPVRVDRLRSLLHWIPDTNIQEGIKKTLQFQKGW